jgi:hypothetical protein
MKKLMIIVVMLVLAGCGGGGGGQSTPHITDLEGTWVYATAGHTTGGNCGLDLYGGYEQRDTVTFTGSSINDKLETCLILPGFNTGGFFLTSSANGTFVAGNVYMIGGISGTESYKTLDVTYNGSTFYTGYFLTGNTFKLAQPTVGYDGSTPAKRYVGAGFSDQPTYLKQ